MDISQLQTRVSEQVQALAEHSGVTINPTVLANPGVTRTRQRQHGDYSCNLALRLARDFAVAPLTLAEQLAERLRAVEGIRQVNAVQPGFINFFVEQESHKQTLTDLLEQGERYGSQPRRQERILLEFVSSNPTGPLHIGHGRGAAYGASLANVLRFYGYQVDCEYYVNDAGRQMSILTVSLWLRYLQHAGYQLEFPKGGYQGQYLVDLGQSLYNEQPKRWIPANSDLATLDSRADDDQQLDRLVEQVRHHLGSDSFDNLKRFATGQVTAIIKKNLRDFGVEFDNWFSEQSLYDSDLVEQAIARLERENKLYNKDGALWFRTTEYGDSKDRVIRRANGECTYFATDIAYHHDKFSRGTDYAINVFGADHHGYIARLKAAVSAFDHDPDRLEICLLQLANLVQGGEKLSMSTRAGQFVELSDLIEETGRDAARFFFLLRRHDQHLDFDLELAKEKSKENPVYYVQYAHARVSQIRKQLQSQGRDFDYQQAQRQFDLLDGEAEQTLIDKLSRFPDCVEQAAKTRSPHLVCQYSRELAALFHNYYASTRILDYDQCWQARVWLSLAVQQVLANALGLLGVSAPEHM